MRPPSTRHTHYFNCTAISRLRVSSEMKTYAFQQFARYGSQLSSTILFNLHLPHTNEFSVNNLFKTFVVNKTCTLLYSWIFGMQLIRHYFYHEFQQFADFFLFPLSTIIILLLCYRCYFFPIFRYLLIFARYFSHFQVNFSCLVDFYKTCRRNIANFGHVSRRWKSFQRLRKIWLRMRCA